MGEVLTNVYLQERDKAKKMLEREKKNFNETLKEYEQQYKTLRQQLSDQQSAGSFTIFFKHLNLHNFTADKKTVLKLRKAHYFS